MLPIADEVWVEARRLRFVGVETGTRMTVVRLADRGLFVHSPVSLDGKTREAVDAIGRVKAVVARRPAKIIQLTRVHVRIAITTAGPSTIASASSRSFMMPPSIHDAPQLSQAVATCQLDLGSLASLGNSGTSHLRGGQTVCQHTC